MRTLALLLLSIIAVSAAELPFKMAPEFSCNLAMSGGQHNGKGRMVVGKEGRRVEISAEHGGQAMHMAMIMLKGEKVTHMLMLDQKMAMTVPAGKSAFQDPTADTNATWEKTGSETVNGVACDRYITKSDSGTSTVWVDADRGVMVRVKDGKDAQIDFTDIKLGAPAASEFVVPPDFKAFDPAAMGGAHGGQ